MNPRSRSAEFQQSTVILTMRLLGRVTKVGPRNAWFETRAA
jgi:hypothetical protein